MFPKISISKSKGIPAWISLAVAVVLVALSMEFWLTGLVIQASAITVVAVIYLCLGIIASRKVQANALLLFGSLVICLLIAEVTVRSLDVISRISEGYSLERSERFHHNYYPNTVFTRSPGPYDEFEPVTNHINSLGIRGPEFEEDASFDIVLIGDSFIQAEEVPYESHLGVVLSQELINRGLDKSVVSHGMSSWAPVTEYNWYTKIGQKFKPKYVFLFLPWNDFLSDREYPQHSDEHYWQNAVFNGDGRVIRFNISEKIAPKTIVPSVKSLHTYRLALYGYRVLIGRVGGESGEEKVDSADEKQAMMAYYRIRKLLDTAQIERLLSLPQEDFETEVSELTDAELVKGFYRILRPVSLWTPEQLERVEMSGEILLRFDRDVRLQGGKLVLVHTPLPIQLGPLNWTVGRYFWGIDSDVIWPSPTGIQEWLQDFATRNGMPLIDPTESLRAISMDEHVALHFRYDGHLNKQGHQEIAQLLADWIESDSP